MVDQKTYLAVAPVRDVTNDLRRNTPWIVAIALMWLAYLLLSAGIACFSENWSYLHSSYFTLINMSTVGFGDVVPSTPAGKVLAGINSVVGLILFGAFVASITMALQPSSYRATLDRPPLPDGDQDDHLRRPPAQQAAAAFVRGLDGIIALREADGEHQEAAYARRRRIDVVVEPSGSGPGTYLHVSICELPE